MTASKEWVRQYEAQRRERKLATMAADRKANPDKYRDQWLRWRYGIGLADYERMVEEQGGACGICREIPKQTRRRALLIDHDHDTGAVRELLCYSCNNMLGRLYDDPLRALAALRYLRKHGRSNRVAEGLAEVRRLLDEADPALSLEI